MPVTGEIAESAALLRAQARLRTPDAVQIATALSFGASCFVTNDEALRGIVEPQVLVLDDFLS